MNPELSLPGTATHQRLLKTIMALYEQRDSVLALLLFGSLGKGAWDAYSDLDLAVIVHDDLQVDLAGEVERVRAAFAAIGEPTLFVETAGDECFFVLRSLHCVAIEYHKLAATSPYLLESCLVLCGGLEVETIRQAAQVNVHPEPALSQQIHRALWLALQVDTALQRRQFWRGFQPLERMQTVLLEIFAGSRGGKRVHKFFEEEASLEMKALFGRTLPHYFADSSDDSLRSLGDALLALLEVLEHHLAELSNGQADLGAGEGEVIAQLRARRSDAV